jgi:serine/threonine protein kinase/predicted ATPase
MGEVFLARREDDPSLLVIKRILPHLNLNQRFLKLFLDETRIAARLIHPNIARIHELNEVNGTWYLAMEYVPGHDLRELMKRSREQEQRIPLGAIVHVATEVARGLHHAHTAIDATGRALRVVHRDVSPHNILVSKTGAVKIVDFGVATAANKTVQTAAGVLKGKFPYMAPEQAHARRVDARTDVFALGIILWEAVCGRFLFRGKTDALTVRNVRLCEVAPLSTWRPGIPAALERVVMRALRKAPEDRFQSAEALAEALTEVARTLPAAPITTWLRDVGDVAGFDVSVDGVPLGADEDDPFALREADTQEVTTPDRPSARRRLTNEEARAVGDDAISFEQARQFLLKAQPPSTNLRQHATSFVGRAAELADLQQLFRKNLKLITLVGPAGTGKTRLASQFAGQLVSYFQAANDKGTQRGGVWYADLGDTTDVDGICAVVARAVGHVIIGGDPVRSVGELLAARGETMILLDNFERVARIAPATVGIWLSMAPQVRFVVSSREILHLEGETVFEVPPLRTPKRADAPRDAESVELFVHRARTVRPNWEPTEGDYQIIAQIVTQLDGIPLAVELAAARMGEMTPSHLAGRLSQRFDVLGGVREASHRQATLRSAIDWSWQMLDEVESAALAQLSVFRGGFSLDEARVVLNLGGSVDVGLVISRLRSRSLVRGYYSQGDASEMRFGLLESVREFAREKLGTGAGAEAAERRHTAAYLSLGAALALGAEGRPAQLDRLDIERENLLAVFDREIGRPGSSAEPLEAVLALDPLLTLRGPFALHVSMLDAAVARVAQRPLDQARGLEARGRARLARGRLSDAESDYLEVIRLADEAGNTAMEGRAESYLGAVLRLRGQSAQAVEHFARSLKLLRAVSDVRMEGRTLSSLGVLQLERGETALAISTFGTALSIHVACGDRRYQGVTLANLGVAEQNAGFLEEARAHYVDALTIHRELGNRRSEGISHINLGDLYCELEAYQPARAHYEVARSILSEAAAQRFVGAVEIALGIVDLHVASYVEAASHLRAGVEILSTVGDRRYEGLGRAALSAACGMAGDVPQAKSELETAERVLSDVGDKEILEACRVYGAHVDLAEAWSMTPADQQAAMERIEATAFGAESREAPSEMNPTGRSSPAARSEHVRAALRTLKIAKRHLGLAS